MSGLGIVPKIWRSFGLLLRFAAPFLWSVLLTVLPVPFWWSVLIASFCCSVLLLHFGKGWCGLALRAAAPFWRCSILVLRFLSNPRHHFSWAPCTSGRKAATRASGAINPTSKQYKDPIAEDAHPYRPAQEGHNIGNAITIATARNPYSIGSRISKKTQQSFLTLPAIQIEDLDEEMTY